MKNFRQKSALITGVDFIMQVQPNMALYLIYTALRCTWLCYQYKTTTRESRPRIWKKVQLYATAKATGLVVSQIILITLGFTTPLMMALTLCWGCVLAFIGYFAFRRTNQVSIAPLLRWKFLGKHLKLLSLSLVLVVFSISGFEMIREEVRDRKVTNTSMNHQTSLIEMNDVFASFQRAEQTIEVDRYLFASRTATWIDHLLYRGSKNIIRKPASVVITRILGATVFPISLVLDIATYSVKGDFQKVKRCALGLISFPACIFSPDLVSQHFVAKKTSHNLIEPYGKLYSARNVELYPKSYEDVRAIIQLAKQVGKKITVAGSLKSQGKQAIPVSENDLLIHLDHLNRVEIDPTRNVAIVESGAVWSDIQNKANDHNLAVRVMQASNIFTIGGSLSINCHGWDHRAGSLKETVLSLLIIDSQGIIQRIYPGNELFDLIIGGMGAFGIILEAELSLTQNCKMAIESDELPVEDYLKYFKTNVMQNDAIDLHYFRLSLDPKNLFSSGIAVNYVKKEPLIEPIQLIDEPEHGNITDRIELGILRKLNWTRSLAWNIEKSSALSPLKTTRNAAMRPPINCIFNQSKRDVEWLQEYFVKKENLGDFIRFLRHTLTVNKVSVYNASVRFVKQNKTPGFSYAQNNDVFAIVLFFNQSLLPQEIQKTKEWIRSVVTYLNEHGGTYYLAYQNFPTLEQFRTSYPEWRAVLQKKQQYDPDSLFTNGFLQEYLLAQEVTQKDQKESKFRSVFSDSAGRDQIKKFLENVFLQLDTEKVLAQMDMILQDSHLSEEEIYRALLKKIDLCSFPFFKRQKQILSSLSSLKCDLSKQVKELIGDRNIHGYVEMGYPGRLIRPLKRQLHLKGPIYVVHDQEKLSDYIESGFPRPYDRFIYLNDYEPIRFEDIPTSSVDLVVLYIGLHHIPEEKLGLFIDSIHRILTPTGSFILMDHDAENEPFQNMLSVVHSIFNAGNRVPLAEEKGEIRNFHSLAYWTKVLKEHNFAIDDTHRPLTRDGDSTKNSLVRFYKAPTTLSEIQRLLQSTPDYVRPLHSTYLTATEWHSVRTAKAYADFIHHTPFYQFPWFQETKNLWSLFRKSWKVARQHSSFREVFFSDHTLMNLFINTMTTVEYVIKGVISAPISWFYTQENFKEPERIHLLIQTKKNIRSLDPRIEIIQEFPNHLQHITIPRYCPFNDILLKLSQEKEEIVYIDIAGHPFIQIDLYLPSYLCKTLDLPPGAKKLYEISAPANPDYRYVALNVEVKHLNTVLHSLTQNQIPIAHIHDF